jgi:hypothetical protein
MILPNRLAAGRSACLLAFAALLSGVALAADDDPAAPTRPAAAGDIDVLTYHYDGMRTGWNPNETALTPASVRSSRFGLLKTLAVDGIVLAQPLLVSGFRMPDGSTHDVLVVVTAHNSVYAFDASTWATLWHVSLGKAQSSDDIGCQQVAPEYGALATPVIVRRDKGAATIYVVSATEPNAMEFHTRLHALKLADGTNERAAVEISPTFTMSDGSTLRFDPKAQWARAGLAHANDSIYVALSSHCDQNRESISGWMQRYGTDLSLMKSLPMIQTPAGTQLAAIWMSGFAPAVDAHGNVYAITGNGNYSRGGKDWGESVVRMDPTLGSVRDWFTPYKYRSLNDDDADFGAGGVMLIPSEPGQAHPLAVAMGKDPTMYLLDRHELGKLQKNDAGALQVVPYGSRFGIWGGPAYWRGPSGGVVFYQAGFDALRSFSVTTGPTPSIKATGAAGTVEAGQGGSLPVVSSSGSSAGTGVVWLVNRGENLFLEAYDAEKLGAPLFSGAAGSWTPGKGDAFVTPLQANGRVYVPGNKTVMVFGLR